MPARQARANTDTAARPGRRRSALTLGALARLRQGTYRLLAALFLYPEPDRLEAARAAAMELCRQNAAVTELAYFDLRPLRVALDTSVAGAEAARAEFVRLFLACSGEARCPPYESAYRDSDRQAAAWTMAELDRTYAAAGLRLSSILHEMPDHISVQLEFMSFLCGREAQAWAAQDAAAGLHALHQECSFLEEHLCRWLPAFTISVAQEDSHGAYGTLAATTHSFVVQDRDLVAALVAGLPVVLAGEEVRQS